MLHIRLSVIIKTERGEFTRVGEVQSYDSTLPIPYGIISYPDSRVKSFILYGTQDDPNEAETIWRYLVFEAKAAQSTNIAYCKIGDTGGRRGSAAIDFKRSFSDFPVNQTKTTDGIESARIRYRDKDGNMLYVSEPYKPRLILGRNAQNIGNDADDSIMAFGANALPISPGQFGQYPLYVWCKSSRWALEVGNGDVAFVRLSPVRARERLVSNHAVINIESNLIYVSADGVKTIPEEAFPLSYPIQNSEHPDDFLKQINQNTRLGYFFDEKTGRKELWVATDNGVYAYSFTMKRWFMIEGIRKEFIQAQGRLLSCIDGKLMNETSTHPRWGRLRTAPITLGAPETLKRFRLIQLVKEDARENPIVNNTNYYAVIEDDLIESPIESILITAEERYAHRIPKRRTEIQVGNEDFNNDAF